MPCVTRWPTRRSVRTSTCLRWPADPRRRFCERAAFGGEQPFSTRVPLRLRKSRPNLPRETRRTGTSNGRACLDHDRSSAHQPVGEGGASRACRRTCQRLVARGAQELPPFSDDRAFDPDRGAGVSRVPGVRRAGARVRPVSVRRLWSQPARAVLVQGARVLPELRRAAVRRSGRWRQTAPGTGARARSLARCRAAGPAPVPPHAPI